MKKLVFIILITVITLSIVKAQAKVWELNVISSSKDIARFQGNDAGNKTSIYFATEGDIDESKRRSKITTWPGMLVLETTSNKDAIIIPHNQGSQVEIKRLWIKDDLVVQAPHTNKWPDYVFEKNHNIMTIPELEAYIKIYKHLPGIPSADDVEENGIDVAEMNALILKKIEELTLHIIKQNKKIEKLSKKIVKMSSK